MAEKYSQELASFCSNLDFDAIPLQVVRKAKWAILDNIGIILGASTTQEGKNIAMFVRDLGDREEATALGFGFKSSMRSSAFINGTLSEMLELQDGYTKGGIHPCCGVISSALAVGEYLKKSGKDLIISIVAGYEVANRVAEVIHPSHLGKGFMPTGTAGTIGAAVAAGKIMGFDAVRMFYAIGIAGFILPISTGDNLWGGYTIKPVHGGAAAKAGIESAMLAQRGLTSCPLEGDPKLNKGFCAIVADNPHFEKMTEGLGEKYTISEIYFKPFACCRINHSPVEIALNLRENDNFRPEDVESVLVKTYSFAASVPGKIRTDINSNLLHCQFSTAYCVAAALMDGQVGLQQFSPERIKDPKIHQLASLVKIEADPEMEKLRPANRPAIVEIILKNRRKVTGRVDYPKGDGRKPLSEDELLKKFEGLASRVLSQEKVKRTESLVFDLEKINAVELIRSCF
jgi:2-methylcitrate dehydratase PrpD